MGLVSGVLGLFGADGVARSVEKVATEYIKAPEGALFAKSQLLKVIDPNGRMRREIALTVKKLYALYILTILILVFAQAYGYGNSENIGAAITSVTDLFVPITTMFSAIISASFGVNAFNVHKGI